MAFTMKSAGETYFAVEMDDKREIARFDATINNEDIFINATIYTKEYLITNKEQILNDFADFAEMIVNRALVVEEAIVSEDE